MMVYQCTFFHFTQNNNIQEKKHFFNLQPGHQGAWNDGPEAQKRRNADLISKKIM